MDYRIRKESWDRRLRRFWRMYRRLILTAVGMITVIVVLVATTGKCSCSCSHEEEVKEAPRKVEIAALGSRLTNEMSLFDGVERMDRDVREFMQYWHLKGMQLSVMRNDSLLFSKGYGNADTLVAMTPGHILRVASISKLITAVGIMKLQEEGKLKLGDKVFAEGGILAGKPYTESIKDPNYYRITVEDLLRHRAGFHAGASDPLFSTLTIIQQNHLAAPPTADELLTILLRKSLPGEPGVTKDYSNVGYLILSLIIEEVSGMSYEDYIRYSVLYPAGCFGFRIARNYYNERHPGEVRYYLTKDDKPVEEFNGSGRMVDRCYGGNDITSLSGAGAWVASSADLARFVASIDGRDGVHDILSRESVRKMTEYLGEETYSIGWNETDPEKGWLRTGTLSGTSAFIKYFPDGECWVMITNTSTWKGPRFPHVSKGTSELYDKLRSRYSSKLPRQDLFAKLPHGIPTSIARLLD